MITLTGSTSISTLSKTIQAPQDSIDNVDETSVQTSFQSLLNNIYSTIDKLPYLKPSLCMFCLDGTNITIKAFSGLWASKNALTLDYTTLQRTSNAVINASNIVPAGPFVANTIYYVYAKYDPSKTDSTDFVIRTDAPDSTNTWLVVAGVTQYNHRYIGSIISQVGPAIVLFMMTNGDYTFPTEYNYGTYTLAALTDVVITFLPLTANVSKMKLVCVNTSPSADSVVTIRPKTVGQYHTINISRSQDHSSGHSYIESPTIGSPYNTFQISVTGGTGSVVLSLVGYKE